MGSAAPQGLPDPSAQPRTGGNSSPRPIGAPRSERANARGSDDELPREEPHDEEKGLRPDPELLRAAFAGSREAYQELVEQLWGLIFVFIGQRISDRGRAEDLTQDTFLQGWEKRESLRDPLKAVSWFLAIASRKVIDAHRWRGARPEVAIPEFFEPAEGASRGATAGGSSAEEKVDAPESLDRVRDVVGTLPELYRTVLILRYWSGLTPAQIARLLGEPEGTIRNRIFRAHLQLRKGLIEAASTNEAADEE